MKVANLPFSKSIIEIHNEMSLYRIRNGDVYKITDKENYRRVERKLDNHIAMLRTIYPEYFLQEYEMKYR